MPPPGSAAAPVPPRMSWHGTVLGPDEAIRNRSQSAPGGNQAVATSVNVPVLRVSREVENIGERVPMSKKRITWRFVFASSEQVHTVMLEHSRMTAKKRLRLDGRRLFNSEHFCSGDWKYEFSVDTHPEKLCVAIKDVKATVVDQRSLDGMYDLYVNGVPFGQWPERILANGPARRRNSSHVWSSELYARRVDQSEHDLEGEHPGKSFTWTFAFGLHGGIHRLELHDLDEGEFKVVLDCRQLAVVNHDDIEGERWHYEHAMAEGQHRLELIVTLVDEDKHYEFFIDGCPWREIGETEFVLQPGWFPVFSRSRGLAYFRNEQTQQTQWDRPIMSRNGGVIEPPTSSASANGAAPVAPVSGDSVPLSLSPMSLGHSNNQKEELNLLDFSEIAVHVSPAAKHAPTYMAFDPFAAQPTQKAPTKPQPPQQSNQLDLLS
ncbi:TPA: hypothetical protein N0F65_008608 [Lagenidium giganteum]|uniref:WW domain-containing protein n=1 Tax=Lagenidium giganteum TaxID=4803 RepID=A0AAV2Z0M4_9STRA|nr:TPA: hypothetical protein N0F65_008608 [Lagenidium giganteum]